MIVDCESIMYFCLFYKPIFYTFENQLISIYMYFVFGALLLFLSRNMDKKPTE
jgi:hypothetical protein